MIKLYRNILVVFITFVILLIIPMCWVERIEIDWAIFTTEWYKILWSSFMSTLAFGFMSYLLIDRWKDENKKQKVKYLIKEQKKILTLIRKECSVKNVKLFLSNHSKIMELDITSLYIEFPGGGNYIIEQMKYYILTPDFPENDKLRKKAKHDISVFAENFTDYISKW